MQNKLYYLLCLSLWRCFAFAALFRENESTPEKVLFSDSGTLNVVLELVNLPKEVTSYAIYKIKNQSYNVVKSGVIPKENEPGKKRQFDVLFTVRLEKSISHTIYKVFLKAYDVYCNRALNREFLQVVYTEKKISVNIHSRIPLDWKNQCIDTAPKETDNWKGFKRVYGNSTGKPRVDQPQPEQRAENNDGKGSERVSSNSTGELRVDQPQPEQTGTRTRQLMTAGACVAGALALLLAGLWVSRCWCRQNSQEEEEEGDYAVPQITYAELALPETDSKPPNKPEKKNYVEIVGVYKNKTKNK